MLWNFNATKLWYGAYQVKVIDEIETGLALMDQQYPAVEIFCRNWVIKSACLVYQMDKFNFLTINIFERGSFKRDRDQFDRSKKTLFQVEIQRWHRPFI